MRRYTRKRNKLTQNLLNFEPTFAPKGINLYKYSKFPMNPQKSTVYLSLRSIFRNSVKGSNSQTSSDKNEHSEVPEFRREILLGSSPTQFPAASVKLYRICTSYTVYICGFGYPQGCGFGTIPSGFVVLLICTRQNFGDESRRNVETTTFYRKKQTKQNVNILAFQ